MVTAFLPLLVTVPLAILFRNYWALVFGSLASKATEAGILLWKSPWKPKFSYSIPVFKEMFGFSFWTMLESFTVWLTQYVGIFIVGNILNDYYLGLYQTSISTVNAYMAMITSAVMPVLFSTLSRLQNDGDQYNKTLFKFQRLIAMFVIPMSVGLFLFRDLVTEILLGKNWMEASGLIGLWSLTSGFTIVYSHICSEVYRSKGKPKISLLAQVIHLVFLIPAIYVSAKHGYAALAVVRPLMRIQGILVHAILLRVVFKISFIEMIKNTFPYVFGACAMALFATALRTVSGTLLWSFFVILLCVLFYFMLISLFPSVRRELEPVLRSTWEKFKQRAVGLHFAK